MSANKPNKKQTSVSLDATNNKLGLSETMCESARGAFDDGDLDEAFDQYQQALKLAPDSVDARVGLGKVWLEYGEYERAYDEGLAALKKTKTRADVYELIGHAQRLRENYEGALEFYAKALEINPKAYVALYGRAIAYDMLGDTNAALQDFKNCLKIAPEFVNAYYDRGVLLANENRLKEAIDDYTKALDRDPNFAHCYIARGEAYTELGEPKRALADFNAALEIDPESAEAHYYRAEAYKQLGDRRAAQRDRTIAREMGFEE